MSVKPSAVEVHIETLVLHGLSPAEAERAAVALREELARHLAAEDVPPALTVPRTVESIEATQPTPVAGASPEALGVSAARAVDGGLRR